MKDGFPFIEETVFRYHSERNWRDMQQVIWVRQLAHSVRYDIHGRKLRFGWSADSDAGEPFFHRTVRGRLLFRLLVL